MLESIITPDTAERNPWDMILLGFLISIASLLLAIPLADYLTVPVSILSIALIGISLAPLLHRVIVLEEVEEETTYRLSLGFITRHIPAISMYSFLFLGMLIAFSLSYLLLPPSTFSAQEAAIPSVRHAVSGSVVLPSSFVHLIENNIMVMLSCFFASFLFGAGSLWLISWNASVVGVAIGMKIKSDVILGILTPFGISIWAFPEILAYLVAAIAGGIVSVAISRHHFMREGFLLAIFDALLFMLIAIFLITVGAYIEHFFV